MDIQQIKERLKASLELQVLRRNLILVTVVTAAFLLICLIGNIDHLNLILPYILFMACVMILPGLIFAIVRTIRIFRKPESYIFCRSTLRQPHGGPIRHSVYYTALLEDPENGERFFVDTHAIFATHGIMPPTIEEYTNATVTIAYNRETEMVVVIG